MFLKPLYTYALGGILIAGLTVSLGIAIKANGAKSETISQLERQITQKDARIEFIQRQWSESQEREGVTHEQAARICAAEGSSAFDRGVAFGRAPCGL